MDAKTFSSSSSSSSPTVKHPSCPRCRSPDTRFCYYDGGATTRAKHFCLSCVKFFWVAEQEEETPVAPFSVPLQSPAPSACSSVASTHNVGIYGDARPSKRRRPQKSPSQRPRLPCPRCDSSCTGSGVYCDEAGRTKRRRIEALHGWISTDEDDAVPAMESSSSSSCSSSAPQPVEEASSPCWTSGGAAGVGAPQDATRVDARASAAGSAEQKPALDLDGNPREEKEMSWEDIDRALDYHLAAMFPPGVEYQCEWVA